MKKKKVPEEWFWMVSLRRNSLTLASSGVLIPDKGATRMDMYKWTLERALKAHGIDDENYAITFFSLEKNSLM